MQIRTVHIKSLLQVEIAVEIFQWTIISKEINIANHKVNLIFREKTLFKESINADIVNE